MREVLVVSDPAQKQQMSRQILEALPEWFGLPDAREQYIEESADQLFLAAMENGEPVGFLCLKQTGAATVELAVMGVQKQLHRSGVGRQLVEQAKEEARKHGYHFMQVKTVQIGMYPEYDATNRFYLAMGFEELEVLPTLWGEANPCQIYVMAL